MTEFNFGASYEEEIKPTEATVPSQLSYPTDPITENILKEIIKNSLPELNRVQAITLKSGDVTFEVRNSDRMDVSAGAAVSITTITNGYNGQILTLVFNDANVTLVHDATGAKNTINLGGANITSVANTTLSLLHDGTSWLAATATNISAVAGTIGGFSIGADYIRDVANTFGLASTVTGGDDVRFWAGDTFANRDTAPLRLTEAGSAFFSNVQIGGTTYQYTITDNGVFSFGDGSDGEADFDGSTAVTGWTRSGSTYTADRDTYFTLATVGNGVTLKPNGYRIFSTDELALSGTATIQRNGNNGTNGADNGDAAAGGAALADGYLKGSLAGAAGGTGANGNGVNGSNVSNALGSNGSAGGAGNGSSASTGGTATAANVKLIANWHLATMLDISSSGSTVKFNNAASAGGGGNSLLNGGVYGGGGGAGSAAGIIAIYARMITISASSSITANGGNGGNGSAGNAFGGGGGGGGNGGQIILVYNVLTNSGSITVAAGSGGTGANGGSAGTNGTAGTIRQFQISL